MSDARIRPVGAGKIVRPADAQHEHAVTAAAFAAEVGRRVRLGRAKRGMTRRQLAHGSGISERYLAQIESGAGNPSAIVLRSVAQALEVAIADLLPDADARREAFGAILDMLSRVPAAQLPVLTALIEARAAQDSSHERAGRIALIGLRGAGKSTLGRMLAQHFGWPLIEIDRVVERDYGASIPDLIEMAGNATFRRYERGALERVVAEHDAAVITTAGGIVANAETYAVLLRRTHTIWVRARPDEHMSRVMAQGDFRPMAQNREAMADLVTILDARQADYARAQAQLDTSDDIVDQSFSELLHIVAGLLGDDTSSQNSRHDLPQASNDVRRPRAGTCR